MNMYLACATAYSQAYFPLRTATNFQVSRAMCPENARKIVL